ncbi:MAG: His/Gly/Thr/Pro-type tRNA ligase C-terminal domain-containing protein, partial [Acidimicrobiales bacterium]
AGAINTLACEGMMRDGKALQMGTSHELGQNFAKAFDIGFLDADSQQQLCWTTSWGSSTRMVGGLIMCHGDDNGLRVPPALAHIQVVTLLIRDEEGAGDAARTLHDELVAAGVRARLDDRVDTAFGRRATDWELKGVPVRIEVGPRDIVDGTVTVVRRDTGEKRPVATGDVAATVRDLLDEIQTDLLAEATAFRDQHTADTATVEETIEAAATGFARVPWVVVRDAEKALAEQAVTVRCIQRADGSVPVDEDEADLVAICARSY